MYMVLNSNLKSRAIINSGVLLTELYIWIPDCLTLKRCPSFQMWNEGYGMRDSIGAIRVSRLEFWHSPPFVGMRQAYEAGKICHFYYLHILNSELFSGLTGSISPLSVGTQRLHDYSAFFPTKTIRNGSIFQFYYGLFLKMQSMASYLRVIWEACY